MLLLENATNQFLDFINNNASHADIIAEYGKIAASLSVETGVGMPSVFYSGVGDWPEGLDSSVFGLLDNTDAGKFLLNRDVKIALLAILDTENVKGAICYLGWVYVPDI